MGAVANCWLALLWWIPNSGASQGCAGPTHPKSQKITEWLEWQKKMALHRVDSFGAWGLGNGATLEWFSLSRRLFLLFFNLFALYFPSPGHGQGWLVHFLEPAKWPNEQAC